MVDAFLFIGLPYLAVAVLIGGSFLRFRFQPFSYSALSSQFLESRRLLWGTLPWHIGILIVLAGHAAAFFAPGLWKALVDHHAFLVTVEIVGIAAALLSLIGLAVLLVRRLTSSRLQAVTNVMDVLLLALLIGQVLTGLMTAIHYRWGASWSTGTIAPYFASLLTLRPNPLYVSELPPLIKLHIVGAWIMLLLVPFSRLVHVFSVPLSYVFRPPQKVVWNSVRREEAIAWQEPMMESRRQFLKAGAGLAVAGLLLSVGVLDKFVRYFRKQDLEPETEAEILSRKLRRLEKTADERELEIERMRKEHILVAPLNQLTPEKGKYFIDYHMRPALAFRGKDGLPNLISAKCTHLGCTVGSDVDAQGRILCPCHVSYFDIATGKPNEGAPAKAPLPKIGWVLMDEHGRVVASRDPEGRLEGTPDPSRLDTYSVYIAKRFSRSEVGG